MGTDRMLYSEWPYVHLCLFVIDWLVNNIDHSYAVSWAARQVT